MAEASTYDQSKTQSAKLRIRQAAARKKVNEQSGVNDELWAEEFEKDLDNKDFDAGWEQYLDEHQEKYPINTKSAKDKKKVSARRRLLAKKVIRKIRKERFDGLAFYSALMLALFNDLVDLLTLGAAGPFLSVTVDPILWVILWMNGSSKIETRLKRMTITTLLEVIPILSLLPIWTGVIIYIKITQDNKVRRLERILRKLRK